MQPEEHSEVPVQEEKTQQVSIHQPTPEQKPTVYPAVADKHTKDIQTRASNWSTMGQILSTYAQEYTLAANIPGNITAIKMRRPRRTWMYDKTDVSNQDTMYFNQTMKEDDGT